jgi:hypothetical protein
MAGMHCSNCGKEVPPFDAKVEIHRPYHGVGSLPGKDIPMWLCPDCAESREAVKRTMLQTFALFFFVLLVLVLIGGLFALWQ